MKTNPETAWASLRRILAGNLGDDSVYVKFHDAQRELFLTMPASVNSHHCWAGGYAVHIDEVCRNIVWLHNNPNGGSHLVTRRDAIIAAYIHDLDKLLTRYELDPDGPTGPQLGKARAERIDIAPHETKASLSKKIDAAVNGWPMPADEELPKHRYRKDARSMDDSAAVLLLCMRHGLDGITDDIVHAVSLHHGGWAPLAQSNSKVDLRPLAVLLHSADLISARIQNGETPQQATQ